MSSNKRRRYAMQNLNFRNTFSSSKSDIFLVLFTSFLTFIILYACNFFVSFYHDDFAYASLSYVYDVGGEFKDRLTFKNLVRFLYYHYMRWGGRTNAFAFAVPLMYLGPGVFFFVQTVITTLIVIFQAKIICFLTNQTTYNFILAVILILCNYMLIPLIVSNDGIYWATASALYVWPMFFLVLGIYLSYIKKFTILTIFLFFLAASSNEVYSVITVTYLSILILIHKNKIKIYWYYLISSFGGLLFIFLSPGNFKRMAFHKVQTTGFFHEFFPGLSKLANFFQDTEYSYFFIISLLLSFLFVFYKIVIVKNKKFLSYLPFIFSIFTITLFYAYPVSRTYRIFTPYYLFIPFIITPIYIYMFNNYKFSLIILGFVIWLAVSNYHFVIEGYYKNYSTAIENDRILRSSKKENEIILKKFPYPMHKNCMPYENRPYINRFIITYYDLKKDVKLIYQ